MGNTKIIIDGSNTMYHERRSNIITSLNDMPESVTSKSDLVNIEKSLVNLRTYINTFVNDINEAISDIDEASKARRAALKWLNNDEGLEDESE